MNNKINKKLTFLLLIKERREFTLRFFSYLNKVKFPFKIFIADGSKKNISNHSRRGFTVQVTSKNVKVDTKRFKKYQNSLMKQIKMRENHKNDAR